MTRNGNEEGKERDRIKMKEGEKEEKSEKERGEDTSEIG